jgi:hypothetical protein
MFLTDLGGDALKFCGAQALQLIRMAQLAEVHAATDRSSQSTPVIGGLGIP